MSNDTPLVVLVSERTLVNLLDEIHGMRKDMDLMREVILDAGAQNVRLKGVLLNVTQDANRLRAQSAIRPSGRVVKASQPARTATRRQ